MENTENINIVQQPPLTDADWAAWAEYISVTFGVSLSVEAVSSFKLFLSELASWNEKINLVSFKSEKEVLYRHFADSLAGAKLIHQLFSGQDPAIADIGAGAGFPGIPVYIATHYKNITQIESITKKANFIIEMKNKLNLSGLKIINDRVENIATQKEHRGAYDFVLSRAVSKLSPNLEIAIPLLKTGGYALLYKTENSASAEELARADKAMKLLGCEISEKFCYTIPDETQAYCAVAFKKIAATPAMYPRRAGIPEKTPL